MAAVRALAVICEAELWELLRSIGGDDHILDVLPKMWLATLAFFEKAAESPGEVVDGTLVLKIEGGREAKVTPRAKRATTDMQRIRRVAARLVVAALRQFLQTDGVRYMADAMLLMYIEVCAGRGGMRWEGGEGAEGGCRLQTRDGRAFRRRPCSNLRGWDGRWKRGSSWRRWWRWSM